MSKDVQEHTIVVVFKVEAPVGMAAVSVRNLLYRHLPPTHRGLESGPEGLLTRDAAVVVRAIEMYRPDGTKSDLGSE